MIEIILFIVVLTLVGGYITWRHGEIRFQEGATAALMNYHKGKIDYIVDDSMEVGYRIEIIERK